MPAQQVIDLEGKKESLCRNLAWGIKPIVVLIEILSVGLLDSEKERISFLNRWLIVYQCFCISLNIAGQAICLNYILQNPAQVSGSYLKETHLNSQAFTWNTVIDYVNFAVNSIACQLISILVVRRRWSTVVEAFRAMESCVSVEHCIAVKIRKVCVVCLAYIIIEVS